MIISTTDTVIKPTGEERALVKWFTGKTQALPVEWNDLMVLVGAIENLGYKVLICKYSCSIASAATNEVMIKNPNADRLLNKKETVWVAIVEMLKWLKK